jgi:hypothetical protein
MKSYIYLGDRHTASQLKGKLCHAVLRPDSKCIRGRNANMLVSFPQLGYVVVAARRLRSVRSQKNGEE